MPIERLTANQARLHLPALIRLLQDAVDNGASVGYLPPLGEVEARDYWEGVIAALEMPYRVLLVATTENTGLAGAVQLHLESRPNGSHRAEVAKLLVHTTQRRQGIGQALMAAAEAIALAAGRTTLVLDTLTGNPAEIFYQRLGYTVAGVVPAYARVPDGTLQATTIFYKLL